MCTSRCWSPGCCERLRQRDDESSHSRAAVTRPTTRTCAISIDDLRALLLYVSLDDVDSRFWHLRDMVSGSAASSLDAELRAWRTAFDTYLYEDMAHAARHFNEAQKLRALNGG